MHYSSDYSYVSDRLKIEHPIAMGFDCDGVLVDTARSYDLAVYRTVEMLFNEWCVEKAWAEELEETVNTLLFRLRLTGNFNNDWDSTYAISILCATAALKNGLNGDGRRSGWMKIIALEELARWGVSASVLTPRTIEEFIGTIEDPKIRQSVLDFNRHTGYLQEREKSRLARTFDELYYGGELFAEMHGTDCHSDSDGLMRNERLLFSAETAERLRHLSAGRMAIITGRPYRSTARSLGSLISFFNMEASTFTGDLDLSGTDAGALRKPAPLPIIKCMKSFGAKRMIYAGNAAEDIRMVQAARMLGYDVLFAAVCGHSAEADLMIDYFKKEGADIIIMDISQLPDALAVPSLRKSD